VGTLVQSSLQLVKNDYQLKNIESDVHIADDLPKVKGNFSKLQQVFINMFINSAQAMPEGGHLCINAQMDKKAKFIRIDVADFGCGIAKDDLEKVFDPFFTTKDVGKGTGLGLSVSYGIIQEIGGRITVDSTEGAGTTFSVYLPIAKIPE
jgi:signal transduction histidine kinase